MDTKHGHCFIYSQNYGQNFNSYRLTGGLTLIELMATIAVLAILSTIVAPAFSSLLQSNQRTTLTNKIIGDLITARSTAIQSRQSVVLCRSANQQDCDAVAPQLSDWKDGWIIFIDRNSNDRFNNATDQIVLSRSAVTPNHRLTFNNWGRIRFNPDSSTRTGRFILCDNRNPNIARSIILYRTGRTRVPALSTDTAVADCAAGP